MAHAQGQGVDEHTLLQGLCSGEGSTHKAAELAQQLGPEVANEQCLAPVGVQGVGRLASSVGLLKTCLAKMELLFADAV